MASNAHVAVPEAIYFDANALIGAPADLATQPIAEAIELAELLGARLLVPEIAVEEWLTRRCEDAIKTMNQMERHASSLGAWLGRKSLNFERITHEDIRIAARNSHTERLRKAGFTVIETPAIPLGTIVRLFLDKSPPFSDGDRGFKDAVIIETIFDHACQHNKFAHIVVVNSDKAFAHAAISTRFLQSKTSLNIIAGDPKDLFANLVELLRNTLSEARNTEWTRRRELATEFAKKYEQQILAILSKNARISRSDLWGYGLGYYGREPDESDAILKHARIISIDAIRPTAIESAFPSDWPRARDDGRIMFLITVAIEIDLTIAVKNYLVEQRVPIDNANMLLESSLAWDFPETQQPLTVSRTITVVGNVAEAGVATGDFQDLRFEGA